MATASHQTRLIAGALPLSCVATSVNFGVGRTMLERTALCDTSRVFIPGKQGEAPLSVSAMFDDDSTAGSYWATLTANYSGDTLFPVTVAPAGFSDASVVWLGNAYQMTHELTSGADDAVDLNLDFRVTGQTLLGQSLDDHAAVTSTSTGSAIDGTAASSNGGVAHLHVTALDTPTTLDVTIEHSVNGSTSWATLVTFTQVTTAVASERVVVAAGTTVRRYLRASYTVAGTSYTCAVAFARA